MGVCGSKEDAIQVGINESFGTKTLSKDKKLTIKSFDEFRD